MIDSYILRLMLWFGIAMLCWILMACHASKDQPPPDR